ncbi:MAG TPA: ABC transporter ATP-binding protein [Clostridia bacterium]|nr:ABC transporter ATP-binding protein [Clostridia bacterium]
MLEIKKVSKQYKTGDLVQNALSSVSLEFRSNEFVAVLGPSGSGKTTLLNIIGGLDRYDSGDLVINGVSTKQYTSRDWDTYRNHTVGFVFQSYNLIPHQSVLSNVELALTLSGVSKQERRRRACEALEQVGLKGQEHKRPNQMSGGQMQRVAIARALVNNPDILLADEPTGALDSETGTQVMELLKKVAKDRLVIMVTHNAELAEQYATRIVKLHDGQISSDTNPVSNDERTLTKEKERGAGSTFDKKQKKKRTSMSFFTALSLSLNNLSTKKGRTFLTSFAGSIGIIGIALILALSTGIQNYVNAIQKDTLTSYPITVEREPNDFMSMLTAANEKTDEKP